MGCASCEKKNNIRECLCGQRFVGRGTETCPRCWNNGRKTIASVEEYLESLKRKEIYKEATDVSDVLAEIVEPKYNQELEPIKKEVKEVEEVKKVEEVEEVKEVKETPKKAAKKSTKKSTKKATKKATKKKSGK